MHNPGGGMFTSRRQTPAEYAREVFDALTAAGSDYASAMHEARVALADCRADDRDLLTLPAAWCER